MCAHTDNSDDCGQCKLDKAGIDVTQDVKDARREVLGLCPSARKRDGHA